MNSMKKVFSLVLVIVLAFGCFSMSASALGTPGNTPNTINNIDYPSIKGVEFIVGNTTYPGELQVDTSLHTATYVAYIYVNPDSPISLNSVSVKVTAGKSATSVALKFGQNTGTAQPISANGSYTWTGINLNSLSGFAIGDSEFSFVLVTDYNLELTSVSIGGINTSATYSLAGSVPRYSARVNITNGDLTSLYVTVSPSPTSGLSYLMDGEDFNGSGYFDFSTSSHVLTVTRTVNYVPVSREYRLYAKDEMINVHVGIRTWTELDWNHDEDERFDYSEYSDFGIYPGDGYTYLDEYAEEIDTSTETGGDMIPEMVNGRPIFDPDNYISVDLIQNQQGGGLSAIDALFAYAASEDVDTVLSFTGTPSSSQSDMTYLSAINDLGEMLCGTASGWMYLVRNDYDDVTSPLPNVSAADYVLSDGQYVDWIYTCAYGMDFGYSMFDLG